MLDVNDIDVYYGQVRALSNVSIRVDKGEIVSVLGANGAGKSTLLRAISGIVRPKIGEIIFNGEKINKLSPDRIVSTGIAHVPEGRRVFPLSSTWDNLLVGAFCRSNSQEVKADAERMLKMFPVLNDRRRELAKMLSGGEQQILAICRALMASPRLLLLDEPSLGLAPIITKEIFHIIDELRKSNVSILLVEQNAVEALRISDRAYVLVTGEVVLHGNSKELMNNDEIRKLYLGDV
jgi:branched-chain amino acid transport system ATP-binding protein